jgi:ankyrin repeat protein
MEPVAVGTPTGAAPPRAPTAAEKRATIVDYCIKTYGEDALSPYLSSVEYIDENLVLKDVEYIVSQGADVNANEIADPPLHVAARFGYTEVVKYLISQGADISAKDSESYTLLHSAVLSGNVDIVKFFVSKEDNVNAKADDGITPLHCAAENGHLDVIKFLISKGADVNAKTDE